MKKALHFFSLVLLVIVLSCKTDETEEAIVTPTPPVITDTSNSSKCKNFYGG
jgi:hypothetical protein